MDQPTNHDALDRAISEASAIALFELRERAGLTQAQAAAAAGMSKKTLERLERLERSLTLPYVVQLAVAYGVTPDSLISLIMNDVKVNQTGG